MLHQILRRPICVYQRTVIFDQCLCRTFSTNNITRITWNIKWINYTKNAELLTETSIPYCLGHRQFSLQSYKQFMHRDDFKTVHKNLNKKDNISEEFTLVYESNTSSSMGLGLFLPVVIILVVCSVIVVSSYIFGVEYPETLPETNVKTKYVLSVLAVCVLLIFLFPTVKNWNKSIIRIYNKDSSDDFIAIIRKNITQREQLPFKKHDAKGYFGRGPKGNFVIKGRSFMVYEEDFTILGNQILFNDWFGSYPKSKS